MIFIRPGNRINGKLLFSDYNCFMGRGNRTGGSNRNQMQLFSDDTFLRTRTAVEQVEQDPLQKFQKFSERVFEASENLQPILFDIGIRTVDRVENLIKSFRENHPTPAAETKEKALAAKEKVMATRQATRDRYVSFMDRIKESISKKELKQNAIIASAFSGGVFLSGASAGGSLKMGAAFFATSSLIKAYFNIKKAKENKPPRERSQPFETQ